MSTEKHPQKPKRELSENDVDKLLYEGFCVEGAFVPQTPDEVARAEGEADEDGVELPASLRDPLALLKGRKAPRTVPRPPPAVDHAAVDNLAMAARNGGDIPPEVEEAMDQDEAAAEEEPGDGAK